ncbi:hypothetical protein KP509_35G055500 [Ceratopteris richardii]|nr:hypothetical protein KP509_35G055500 [Ceratopteris richardii]
MELGDGAYVTSIYIGTPARRAQVVLDTGSDLVWQQCRPCTSCFAQRDMPMFDPAGSSSFRRIPCSNGVCQRMLLSISPVSTGGCARAPDASCEFSYMYGDNSMSAGSLGMDTLTLLDPRGQGFVEVQNFVFGCGYTNRGDFAGSDGILGMGQGPLSLASQVDSPSFSYCLTPSPISASSRLLIGEHASAFLHTEQGSQAQMANIMTNKLLPSFYYLNLTAISLSGVQLDIPYKTFSLKANGSGGMIIDSGTTLTYLQQHAYSIVRRSIAQRVGNQLPITRSVFGMDLCFMAADEGLLPTLTLHFNGANMEIPSSTLFLRVGRIHCLAMARTLDLSILGNIHQGNYQILFDRRYKKLSFMQTTCEGGQN